LASTFINTGNKLHSIVSGIEQKMLDVGLKRNHLELYQKLMTYELKANLNTNKSLFGSDAIKQMCSLMSNNLTGQPIQRIEQQLRIFKHYGKLLKVTDVLKNVTNMALSMYNVNK
jgi:hypothetical protein